MWSQHAHVGLSMEEVGPLKCHLFGATLRCPRLAVFCSGQKQHRAGLHIAVQLAERLHSPTVCIALAITACDGGFFHQLDLCFQFSYLTRATIFKVAIFELLSFAFTCPPSPLHCPWVAPFPFLTHMCPYFTMRHSFFFLFVGLSHPTSSFKSDFNLILCQLFCCRLC